MKQFDSKDCMFMNAISTHEQTINKQNILDKYRTFTPQNVTSITQRNQLLPNDTFDQDKIISSINKLTTNNSHIMKARNISNIGFHQYSFNVSDMTDINGVEYTMSIPWNMITGANRETYRTSIYYGQWVHIRDMYNSEIFDFTFVMFINQRVYSDFAIMINENEIKVKFPVIRLWQNEDANVIVMNIPTSDSLQISMTVDQLSNRYNYNLPIELISPIMVNNKNVMMFFNRRTIETLGHNIEFVQFKGESFNLRENISKNNLLYIHSDFSGLIDITIISPAFLREYPTILPLETVYRPHMYTPYAVHTNNEFGESVPVHESDGNEIFVSLDETRNHDSGFNTMIRPMVLSDTARSFENDPLDLRWSDIRTIRNQLIKTNSIMELFSENIMKLIGIETVNQNIDQLKSEIIALSDLYIKFNHELQYPTDVIDKFENEMVDMLDDIRVKHRNSIFMRRGTGMGSRNIFGVYQELHSIITNFIDRYSISEDMRHIPQRHLWKDEIKNIRYTRPVDPSDMIVFEFNVNQRAWYPTDNIIIKHQFPDVYLLEQKEIENKVYKVFFFYSDTPNVINTSREDEKPSPKWDKNIERIYHDGSMLRDVFIEQIYWSAMENVYQDYLITGTKWELLQYVIGNIDLMRYNDLFLETVEPFIKNGMEYYIQSEDFGFLMNHHINKLKEHMQASHLAYNRTTSMENYLKECWSPSYFDYTMALSDAMTDDRIINRPNPGFNLSDMIKFVHSNIMGRIRIPLSPARMNQMLIDIEKNNLHYIDTNDIKEIIKNLEYILTFADRFDDYVNGLNHQIYELSDIEYIRDLLSDNSEYIDSIKINAERSLQNFNEVNHIAPKSDILARMDEKLNEINVLVDKAHAVIMRMNLNEFVFYMTDNRTLASADRFNPDDKSILSKFNKFTNNWSLDMQERRDRFFLSNGLLKNNISSGVRLDVNQINSISEQLKNIKDDFIYMKDYTIEKWRVNPSSIDTDLEKNIIIILDMFIDIESSMEELNDLVLQINTLLGITLEILNEYKDFNSTENCLSIISKVYDIISGVFNRLSAGDFITIMTEVRTLLRKLYDNNFIETAVFTELNSLSAFTDEFVDPRIINSLVQYLEYVLISFIPDENDYVDFRYNHEAIQLDIVNGGINYSIGDIIIFPNLGSGIVDDVDDGVITAISMTKYRNKTFRNPMNNKNYFHGRSFGDGFGAVVKVTKVKSVELFNDSITDDIVSELKSHINVLTRNLVLINSERNKDVYNILDLVNVQLEQWNSVYRDSSKFISPTRINSINSMIDELNSLQIISNEIMSQRSNIQLSSIMTRMHHFRSRLEGEWLNNRADIIAFVELLYQVTENYNENRINVVDDLNWAPIIKNMITDIADNYFQEHGDINRDAQLAINELSILSDIIIHISSELTKINESNDRISQLDFDNFEVINPNHYINNFIIVDRGNGFSVGDIVSIKPRLRQFEFYVNNHSYIKSDDGLRADISINLNMYRNLYDWMVDDVLMFRVSRIDDNGSIMDIVPITEYMISYPIGVEVDIIPIISDNGTGANAYVSTTSSIQTLPPINYNKYNSEDLYVFKFRNGESLDINYNIFFHGIQTQEFIFFPSNNNGYDSIYINANLMDNNHSRNISFEEKEEIEHFRVEYIRIEDGGAGYSPGQRVFIVASDRMYPLIVDQVSGLHKSITRLKVPSNHKFLYDPSVSDFELIPDVMNNIDDEYSETRYSRLKPTYVPMSNTTNEVFLRSRFDSQEFDYINELFRTTNISWDGTVGDRTRNWMLGSDIKRSTEFDYYKYIRFISLNTINHPYMTVKSVVPPNISPVTQFHLLCRTRIHTTNPRISVGKENVKHIQSYEELPENVIDNPDVLLDSIFIIERDSRHDNKTTLNRVRGFSGSGGINFYPPILYNEEWNQMNVNWFKDDWYFKVPALKTMYPSLDWSNSSLHTILQDIDHNTINRLQGIRFNNGTYIHDVTMDDICIYNWTLHKWEDVNNDNWTFNKTNDGFELIYNNPIEHDYEMHLYIIKSNDSQIRNSKLIRNGRVTVVGNKIIPNRIRQFSISTEISFQRNITFRKLYSLNIVQEIDESPIEINTNQYFQNKIFMNDIHLMNNDDFIDIKKDGIYFSDPNAVLNGVFPQSEIRVVNIINSGYRFNDGKVWLYNSDNKIHLFGNIKTRNRTISDVIITHIPNIPRDGVYVFDVYQNLIQTKDHRGRVRISFKTTEQNIYENGKIQWNGDTNAQIKHSIIFDKEYHGYKMIINKNNKIIDHILTPRTNSDIKLDLPTNSNSLYIMTERGRLPLLDPIMLTPLIEIHGNIIKPARSLSMFQRIWIGTVPYSMKSVFSLREIPEHGYINMDGVLNKPLNKKYFEFWVNGRLLDKEVNIITPSKIILKGLTSLRNLEIIEIDRNPNEVFSDAYLDVDIHNNRPINVWNYRTYLDDVIDETLSDNYSEAELYTILYPLWPQLEKDHPEFINYPSNVNIDLDIFANHSIANNGMNHAFNISNIPTINDAHIIDEMTLTDLNMLPFTNEEIVALINDVFEAEINSNEYLNKAEVINENSVMIQASRMFDSNGKLTNDPFKSVYSIDSEKKNIIKEKDA